MRARIVLTILSFLILPLSISAQTLVTATFLTPAGQTPSQANLKTYATIAGTPMCGHLLFVPYNSAGGMVIRLIWNGTTYFPQPVAAYIRCSDGALINGAGAVGLSLVPNSDAQPAGTVYQMSGSLNGSTDGITPAASYNEQKSVPDQPTVDWSSLPVPIITQPQFAIIYGTGAVNMDLEVPAPTDSGIFQWEPKNSISFKRISCSTDTGTVSVNFDIRTEAAPNTAGTQILFSPVICSPTTGVSTTFAVAIVPGQSPVALLITAVSGSPGIVRVHAEY